MAYNLVNALAVNSVIPVTGISSTNGSVISIANVANVTIYTYPTFPTVNVAPSPTGNTATAIVVQMIPATWTIVSGGIGYAVNDTINITGGTITGNGDHAALLTVLSVNGNGTILTANATSRGIYSTYPSMPTSGTTSGNGTGATATATSWSIYNIGGANSFQITSGGSGYISNPTVTLSGGETATASLGSALSINSLAANNALTYNNYSIFNDANGDLLFAGSNNVIGLNLLNNPNGKNYVTIYSGNAGYGASISTDGNDAGPPLYLSSKGGAGVYSVSFFSASKGIAFGASGTSNTANSQGGYLFWNASGVADGKSWLVNNKGGGSGGWVFATGNSTGFTAVANVDSTGVAWFTGINGPIGNTTANTVTATWLNLGSQLGANNTDTSKHINMYGNTYGLSISSGSFNYTASATGTHTFLSGNVQYLAINSTAVSVNTTISSVHSIFTTVGFGGPIGVSQPNTGNFSSVNTGTLSIGGNLTTPVLQTVAASSIANGIQQTYGLAVSWNYSGGLGETDLILNVGAGGAGGMYIYQANSTGFITSNNLILTLSNTGSLHAIGGINYTQIGNIAPNTGAFSNVSINGTLSTSTLQAIPATLVANGTQGFGLAVSWNYTGGLGEVDLILSQQGGSTGGLYIYQANSTGFITSNNLILALGNTGSLHAYGGVNYTAIGNISPSTGIFTTLTASSITATSGLISNTRIKEIVRVVTTGNTTITTSDNIILMKPAAAAPTTVYLPSGSALGDNYSVKDSAGNAANNNITLVANGNLIDGANTFVMTYNYEAVSFISDGTNWNII